MGAGCGRVEEEGLKGKCLGSAGSSKGLTPGDAGLETASELSKNRFSDDPRSNQQQQPKAAAAEGQPRVLIIKAASTSGSPSSTPSSSITINNEPIT